VNRHVTSSLLFFLPSQISQYFAQLIKLVFSITLFKHTTPQEWV